MSLINESSQLLQEALAGENIAPHVRHWWQQLIKGIEERWRKVIEKWPDPWHKWEGVLDEGEGMILIEGGAEIPIHYRIWYQQAARMSEASGWSGTAESGEILYSIESGTEYVLQLQDQKRGRIIVHSTSFSSGQGGTLAFGGQGAFPA